MTIQDGRFTEDLYRKIINMISRSDQELPPYDTDSRKRDEALQTLWRSESLISSVVAASVARDKNRGWTLTGGVRLVSQYARKLHDVHYGAGWRNFISLNATQYYTTNLGYVSEIIRSEDVPESLVNVDVTRTRLTNSKKYPLIYYPKNGGKVQLKRIDYIHSNSMPNFQEKYNYTGFCSLERALLFTRLMIGLHYHQLEKLGIAPPKGILMGSGISQTEWDNAVESFRQDKRDDDLSTYDGVFGLFTKDPNAKLQVLGLSTLPDNFSLDMWLDNIMKAYSLAFGVPVYTFWTPESGTFGRGKEINEMRSASTYIGELEFALSFQEQIQKNFLPPSVIFDFNMRDDDATEQLNAIRQQKITEITELKNAGFITVEQGQTLLAEAGIIPKEYTTGETGYDKSIATDLQEIRERARANFVLRQYASKNPKDPIVLYRYESRKELIKPFNVKTSEKLYDYDFPYGDAVILFDDYDELTAKRIF